MQKKKLFEVKFISQQVFSTGLLDAIIL